MYYILGNKTLLRIVGINLIILSMGILICIAIAWIYSEPVQPFILASGIAITLSAIFLVLSKNHIDEINIGRREAFLAVILSWLLISLLGSLPYIFSGSIRYFIDAVFESVSGFTTTGSSILNDIESLPKSILFWRSLTHWIGGIGIIILMIIVMPSFKTGGYHLFTLESSMQDKIRPRIKSTGKRLLLIYVAFTVLEIIFLLFGGMNVFDSICHAFGTVATGGFSTKNASIAEYSPYIQYVIMVFMLLAGINFSIYYFLLAKDFGKVGKNEEVKSYLKVVFVLGLLISISLYFKTDKSLELSFREGFFQLISIVSCTGFSTSDYSLWPGSISLILMFSMFLGGSTGSTSGGIKIARHLILVKNIRKTIQKMLCSNAVIPLKINGVKLEDEMNTTVLSFLLNYLIFFIIASLTLIFLKVGAKTAFSAVATCLAGIGPGIDAVGPAANFSHLTPAVKLILSFVMLAGRLEIYSFLILFTPAYWRV